MSGWGQSAVRAPCDGARRGGGRRLDPALRGLGATVTRGASELGRNASQLAGWLLARGTLFLTAPLTPSSAPSCVDTAALCSIVSALRACTPRSPWLWPKAMWKSRTWWCRLSCTGAAAPPPALRAVHDWYWRTVV